jgi:hypothetical protein
MPTCRPHAPVRGTPASFTGWGVASAAFRALALVTDRVSGAGSPASWPGLRLLHPWVGYKRDLPVIRASCDRARGGFSSGGPPIAAEWVRTLVIKNASIAAQK